MSARKTAIIRTAVIMSGALAIGAVTSLILMFLTLVQIGILFCVVALVMLATLVYDFELSRAKSLEELKELSKSSYKP
jgi:hypothetical protein